MARQLTSAIDSATGTEGVADSSVELVMVFASGTYMEHISENVTYRRLMLVDKVSAPRDFWIKWTRLDGAVAHPISAHVTSDSILFELGEDVEQTIRDFADKIQLVHFRNTVRIDGKSHFRETFHDNGALDMAGLMGVYRECGINVPIRVDHVPAMAGEKSVGMPGYDAIGRYFAIGYLKGIIDATR